VKKAQDRYDVIKDNRDIEGQFQAMKSKNILVLIVATPSSLQKALMALITTIPSISAVLVAEDTKSAWRIIENHQPTMIILDVSLLKVQDVIKQIKTQWPQIHLIVLADDLTLGKDVETLGADCVLIKGFSPQKLIEVIDNFIASIETI
jgi:DNA-binding NarL/FixJ family response regulator